MDAAQIATLLGAAVGSAASAYFAAKRRVSHEQAREIKALQKKIDALEERRSATLTDERIREVAESAMRDYVTVEEFRAYAQLDGSKRDSLLEKIGELRGIVAELPRRR